MADKNNENRFLAMLERRGIVRKTDAEDEVADFEPRSTWSRSNNDNVPKYTADPPVSDDFDNSTQESEPAAEQPRVSRWGLPFSNRAPAPEEDTPAEEFNEPPPSESRPETFLDMDGLYAALALKARGTDTIYLIEEYLKTLPVSLPEESRRDIIVKIIAASGFEYDRLIGDGVLRVKMLKDYAEQFAKRTDDYIAAHNEELEELERQISRVRKIIEDRKELHKRQFFAIEAEAQRLKNLLTFISG